MAQQSAKDRRLFKLKLLVGLAFAVVALVTIAAITYRTMTGLTFALSEEARHKKKIIYLNEVMSDLSNAESSVRTFTITHDADYLGPYQDAVSSIEERIMDLYELTVNELQKKRLDSFEVLINQKYQVFNDLLNLRRDSEVDDILAVIITKIEQQEREAENDRELSKLSKLKELFLAKKQPIEENSTDPLSTIKEVVTRLQRQEKKKTEDIIERENQLTKVDAEVMEKIRAVVANMEQYEVTKATFREQNAKTLARRTTVVISVITFSAFILLVIMAYVIFSYVTRTTRLNREMSDAKDKAEKLAKAKEEFLASMSHEIRTPMNAILGFSEQMGKTDLDARQKTYVDTIKNSTEHLLVVVNDILDHAKIEAEKFSFESVGFFPSEVIHNVYESFRQIAREKDLKFTSSIDQSVPSILIGDPYRLKQILFNLIGNALKFTEEGKVGVIAKSILKSSNSVMLKVDIADTGVGIPAEKLEKIFEDFYQSDSSTTRKYGGTGLGLSITKNLVELQGGSIEAKSEVGVGTSFSFTVPYQIGTEADIEEKIVVPANPEQLFKGLSVLVVDDESYNRLLLDAILIRWGMNITSCDSGKKAIEELERNHYDLVLMDVRMPDFSGLDATMHIRSKMPGNKAEVPIIALTAARSEDDIKKCKAAGMNEFLSKPFREADLFEKICAVLRIDSSKRKWNQSHGNGTSQISNGERDYDLSELNRMSHGDKNFVNEMIKVFIQNSIEVLNKMNEAAANNDWDKVGLYAHRLAAPCRHIGMTKIVKTLKEIENKTLNNENLDTIITSIQLVDTELKKNIEILNSEVAKEGAI